MSNTHPKATRGPHTTPERQARKEANHEAFRRSLRERFGGPAREAKHACLNRLLGLPTHRLGYPGSVCHRPPESDHASLWLVGGRPIAFVSQPYPCSFHREEAGAFAAEHGLEVEVSDGSWWLPSLPGEGPGGTLLVVYTRKEPVQ